MSGFKDDVISIIRDNMMLHGEAIGLIMHGDSHPDSRELVKDLQDRNFPVTDKSDKHVFFYDYVVVHHEFLFVSTLLKSLCFVSKLGIIILDITGKSDMFRKEYASSFGGFLAHKLTYGDRVYLVLKNGADYGN